MATEQTTVKPDEADVANGRDVLSVKDERTGKTYELEITDGTIKAPDLRQIKVSEDDFGLMSYDPAFLNTASCRSRITWIDGDKGELWYAGIPIEQLCEHSTYLEVAYLLIYGELPTKDELERWMHDITIHTFVHENIKMFVEGFRYDAHPMGMLLASVGALSTFYPDAAHIDDQDERYMATIRMIAKMPTLAAFAYRHNRGPDRSSHCGGSGAYCRSNHGGRGYRRANHGGGGAHGSPHNRGWRHPHEHPTTLLKGRHANHLG